MTRTTRTLENPATGERIEIRRSPRDGTGDAEEDAGPLTFDYYLAPGGFAVGKFDHVHPRQEERFDVRSGELGVRIDGDEWTATPGSRFAILPGTAHTVWNAGDEPVHAVIEIRPALRVEEFFETTYGLAREGKTDDRGLPTPLQLAVLADEYRDEIRFGAVPDAVEVPLAALAGTVGRLAGYRARYPRFADRN